MTDPRSRRGGRSKLKTSPGTRASTPSSPAILLDSFHSWLLQARSLRLSFGNTLDLEALSRCDGVQQASELVERECGTRGLDAGRAAGGALHWFTRGYETGSRRGKFNENASKMEGIRGNMSGTEGDQKFVENASKMDGIRGNMSGTEGEKKFVENASKMDGIRGNMSGTEGEKKFVKNASKMDEFQGKMWRTEGNQRGFSMRSRLEDGKWGEQGSGGGKFVENESSKDDVSEDLLKKNASDDGKEEFLREGGGERESKWGEFGENLLKVDKIPEDLLKMEKSKEIVSKKADVLHGNVPKAEKTLENLSEGKKIQECLPTKDNSRSDESRWFGPEVEKMKGDLPKGEKSRGNSTKRKEEEWSEGLLREEEEESSGFGLQLERMQVDLPKRKKGIQGNSPKGNGFSTTTEKCVNETSSSLSLKKSNGAVLTNQGATPQTTSSHPRVNNNNPPPLHRLECGKIAIANSRNDVTVLFCPKSKEEKCTRYSLTFANLPMAEEFTFDLLKRAPYLMDVIGGENIGGVLGLVSVSVSQTAQDRTKAENLLRVTIPKQTKTFITQVNKISKWWRAKLSGKKQKCCATTTTTPFMLSDAITPPMTHAQVRRRRRRLSIASHNKILLASLLKIQKVVKDFLIHKRRVTASKIIQHWFRAKSAKWNFQSKLLVLSRFFKYSMNKFHRRRLLTFQLVQAREDLISRTYVDVMDFAAITNATMIGIYPLYDVVIGQLRETVLSIYPTAVIEPFGSSVTGLALPSSDLDLVVTLFPGGGLVSLTPVPPPVITMPFPLLPISLEESASILRSRLANQHDWVRSTALVGSSTQPVIKLVCHARAMPQFQIQVDVTIWHPKHTGVANSAFLRDSVLRVHPQVGAVVLILKQLLRECNLNSVYSGGLSSVALVVMTWIYVREKCDPSANVGEILLRCLSFFGQDGFFSRYGFSSTMGLYVLSYVEERQEEFQPPAVIEDPLREGNNLGIGSFRASEISACFRKAAWILSQTTHGTRPLNALLRCRGASAMMD